MSASISPSSPSSPRAKKMLVIGAGSLVGLMLAACSGTSTSNNAVQNPSPKNSAVSNGSIAVGQTCDLSGAPPATRTANDQYEMVCLNPNATAGSANGFGPVNQNSTVTISATIPEKGMTCFLDYYNNKGDYKQLQFYNDGSSPTTSQQGEVGTKNQGGGGKGAQFFVFCDSEGSSWATFPSTFTVTAIS